MEFWLDLDDSHCCGDGDGDGDSVSSVATTIVSESTSGSRRGLPIDCSNDGTSWFFCTEVSSWVSCVVAITRRPYVLRGRLRAGPAV